MISLLLRSRSRLFLTSSSSFSRSAAAALQAPPRRWLPISLVTKRRVATSADSSSSSGSSGKSATKYDPPGTLGPVASKVVVGLLLLPLGYAAYQKWTEPAPSPASANMEKKGEASLSAAAPAPSAAAPVPAVNSTASSQQPSQPQPSSPPSQQPPTEDKLAPKESVPEPHLPLWEYKYVMIGAGTASFSAAKTILEKEPNARILIIGEEPEVPYMRPPLSKELWFAKEGDAVKTLRYTDWNGNERSLFYQTSDAYGSPTDAAAAATATATATELKEEPKKEENVDFKSAKLLTGVKVKHLDIEDKLLKLENGQDVRFDKLLIATGGKPRSLPQLASAMESESMTTYRTVADFRSLEELSHKPYRVAIIGGGFLGSELACALAQKRKTNLALSVTQIFPEEGNMGMIFPRYLSQWTTRKIREAGVNVLENTFVMGANIRKKTEANDVDKVELVTEHIENSEKVSKTMEFDHVVVAVGIEPNAELGREAGLEVDPHLGGIVVNAELEARSDVFAAGDVSSYHDIALGRRRVEHHDHAVLTGRVAGKNMQGARMPYRHQSFFWSDLGPNVGYEAVGILDSRLETVGVWAIGGKKDTPQAAQEKAGDEKDVRSGAMEIKDSSEAAESPLSAAPPAAKLPEGVTIDATGAVPASAEEEDKYGKGVVFYMRDKRVVGVLLWNLYDRVGTARKIIRDKKQYDDLSELAKLFRIN